MERSVISELNKIEETKKENQIRKGGKQKSGKPPLKHSNFFIIINTGENNELTEEVLQKYKNFVNLLSAEIENNILILQGSDQGLNNYGLPKEITKEQAWERVEKQSAKVNFYITKGKQSNKNFIYYLFALSKRALDSQINNLDVLNYSKKIFPSCETKTIIYRDAKGNINNYINSNLSL